MKVEETGLQPNKFSMIVEKVKSYGPVATLIENYKNIKS